MPASVTFTSTRNHWGSTSGQTVGAIEVAVSTDFQRENKNIRDDATAAGGLCADASVGRFRAAGDQRR
jgi:hypothetical protein